MNKCHNILVQLLLISCLYMSGCVTTPPISYQNDVRPIFVNKCIDCHTPPYGEGYRRTGLDMVSYESLMEGSIYGPVVIPGNSKASPLNMQIEGRVGNLSQQLKNRQMAITEHEIKILHLWIEQGALNN